MKNKITKNESFDKAYHRTRHLGPTGNALYGYVENFESQGKVCFASREFIGRALYISPATVSRTVKELVKKGYLRVTYRGKNRVLTTNPEAHHLYQNDTDEAKKTCINLTTTCINLNGDLYQNDTDTCIKLTDYLDIFY